MDAGDILYVVLMLIFAIFGFFNKSKKESEAKKQQSGTPGSTPLPPPVFKKELPPIFRELFPDTPDTPERTISKTKTESPIPIPVPQKKAFVSSVSDSISAMSRNEGQSSISGSLYKDDADEEVQYSRPHPLVDALREDSAGEFRKAIIYSEILNPKYNQS